MATRTKHAFSEIFGQSVVVCLLALFIVTVLIAMLTTDGTSDETEWIGITARSLDAETAAALGIPSDMGGVIVAEVDGMAQAAGIRHGDVLLGINGEPVRDVVGFSNLAGRTDLARGGARLDIIRRGTRMPVYVLPKGLPRPVKRERDLFVSPAPAGIAPPPAAIDRRWFGIEAETFMAGEGRELGIPAGVGGVLIDGVAGGSPAEQAGLVVNDVIVSTNGWKTDTTADLWNTLAGLDAGAGVEFGVYRRGRLVSAALPAALGAPAGGFPGRMGGWGPGQGGFLVCPSCGTSVARQRGVPRLTVPCPSCGTFMVWTQ